MRATGIVRRIDDLGRIVIPLEIRKTMSISENEPLEIFVEKDKIILQKYKVNLQEETYLLADRIATNYGYDKADNILSLLSKVKVELAHLENEG